MERVDGKAAGDHAFITCQRIGLADEARADAIPNAAGGEGGHGAAKFTGTQIAIPTLCAQISHEQDPISACRAMT
jgi:hypothetical protein